MRRQLAAGGHAGGDRGVPEWGARRPCGGSTGGVQAPLPHLSWKQGTWPQRSLTLPRRVSSHRLPDGVSRERSRSGIGGQLVLGLGHGLREAAERRLPWRGCVPGGEGLLRAWVFCIEHGAGEGQRWSRLRGLELLFTSGAGQRSW